MQENTPMIKQYLKIKEEYPDCILFFRLGDFYEMFFEDAVLASKLLDLTLTARAKNSANPIAMCGVPHHASDNYILKLNEMGHKVAICEQVEEASDKKIVERKVVRVLTPASNLDCESANNSLNLVIIQKLDSNYIFAYTSLLDDCIYFKEQQSLEEVIELIHKYQPSEILLEEAQAADPVIYRLCEQLAIKASIFDAQAINTQEKRDFLEDFFGSCKLETIARHDARSAEVFYEILNYLENLEANLSRKIKGFAKIENLETFELNIHAIKNLELFYNQNDFSKTLSLMNVIDRSKTNMGRRLLRNRLLHPFKSKDLLLEKYDNLQAFLKLDIQLVAKSLAKFIDLDKLESQVRTRAVSPGSLCHLYFSLEQALQICNSGLEHKLIEKLANHSEEITEVRNLLSCLELENPAKNILNGYIFKAGHSMELAELRNLLENSKEFLDEIVQREIQETGISNLKIKYNKVFGYFIEVSKGKIDQVPERYIRKQTLANAERFITPELKDLETRIIDAQGRLFDLEYKLYLDLVEKMAGYSKFLGELSKEIAELDLCVAFSKLTVEKSLTRPEIVAGKVLEIQNGRHIVIESLIKNDFIRNHLDLGKNKNSILITGPNMGGKSTFLRQNALIVLLAQIGLFVPADSLKYSICDQIFVRVGAWDNLTAGESTFMVEMNETAAILKQASESSLIILDEIGRGTATVDGLSLATAIFNHIHNRIGAKLLFATHYHELIERIENVKQAANYHVGVFIDEEQNPTFLYKIQNGGMPKSFGIEVAKLAGLPAEVIKEGQSLMNEIKGQGAQLDLFRQVEMSQQESLESMQEPMVIERKPKNLGVIEEIRDLDLNALTPIQAMLKFQELKDKIID